MAKTAKKKTYGRLLIWSAPHLQASARAVRTKRGTWLAELKVRGHALRQEYESLEEAKRALRAYVDTFVMP
ncbi:MAG: hypothetical protein RML84_09310 [Anaerolineae bacterium]|nr:hypothetical protein [Anaerolineae bacterium]